MLLARAESTRVYTEVAAELADFALDPAAVSSTPPGLRAPAVSEDAFGSANYS